MHNDPLKTTIHKILKGCKINLSFPSQSVEIRTKKRDIFQHELISILKRWCSVYVCVLSKTSEKKRILSVEIKHNRQQGQGKRNETKAIDNNQ